MWESYELTYYFVEKEKRQIQSHDKPSVFTPNEATK